MAVSAPRAFQLACRLLTGASPLAIRVGRASLPLARVDPATLPARQERLLREFLRVTSAWRGATVPLDEATARWWADWILATSLELHAASTTAAPTSTNEPARSPRTQ